MGSVKTIEYSEMNDQKMIDRQIVEGCIAGNPKYQQLLYERFAEDLYFICRRYTNSNADAEDLLQNVFIKIFLNLKDFKFESSLKVWTRMVTVNAAISNLRRIKREPMQLNYENCEDGTLPIVEVPDAEIPMEALIEIIRGLPDGYRSVFNMREIDGYDFEGIAEQLGLNPGTVRSQLFKAKVMLKKKIEEWINNEKDNDERYRRVF